MGSKARRMVKRGSSSAKKALKDLEKTVMAIEGRRSVRAKRKKAKRVGKQAATAGLIVGALAAVQVIIRELMKHDEG
jgi:Pyruvate/2-oxoacid:ferredoxin oxidoreductase gamma subunit